MRLSALCTDCYLSPGRLLVFISVRGWINPSAIIQLKGSGQLKTLMTSLGIKHATFQLEAQCLNQLCYHVTLIWLPHKSPHLHGSPKMHKPDILLRPVVNSTGFPCYALAGFLHKILSPLARKSESYVKNSGHFIQLLKSVNLQSLETEIRSIMVIHWWNDLSCSSKPLQNCWKYVWEPHIFRWMRSLSRQRWHGYRKLSISHL
jgi:hypothetical protein